MFNFPISVDFMKDKRINDLLYSFCLLNSFVAEDDERCFCWKRDVTPKKVVEYFKGVFSEKQIRSDFKELIKAGFVAEGSRFGIRVYYINNIKEYININKYILETIVKIRIPHLVKVYAYLKAAGAGYAFTEKELLENVGYSASNMGRNNIINNILYRLREEGIIKYKNELRRGFVPFLVLEEVRETLD